METPAPQPSGTPRCRPARPPTASTSYPSRPSTAPAPEPASSALTVHFRFRTFHSRSSGHSCFRSSVADLAAGQVLGVANLVMVQQKMSQLILAGELLVHR